MSTGKKVGIGIAIATAICGVAFFVIKRGRNLKAAENEIKQLAQKIEFSPASTIEEAKAFAEKHLDIKSYDIDNLEVANWVNEGLTKISNVKGGKTRMPKTCQYKAFDDDIATMAGFYHSAKQGDTLLINKNYIENINTHTKQCIDGCQNSGLIWIEGKKIQGNPLYIKDMNEIKDICSILIKANQNIDSLSLKQKMQLQNNLSSIVNEYLYTYTNPMKVLEQIVKSDKAKNLLGKSFETDVLQISKKSLQEQQAFCVVQYIICTAKILE